MQETWVQSLGWEDPLEEGMATPSSILAWKILSVLSVFGLCFWHLLLGTFVFRLLYSIDESCLEDPTDRGAWRAIIHGLRSRTRLKPRSMHALLKEFSVHGPRRRNLGGAWKRSYVCVQLLSRVRLFATPWMTARQAPLSIGFSRQDSSIG